MNKREKEIFEGQLEDEDKVLKDLERIYQKAMRDIENKIKLLQSDELTNSRIYQIQYQKALKGQIDGILEKLHGDEFSTIQKYLSDTYTNSFVGTMYAMHGQGVPVMIPIDRRAAAKAVVTDSKLSVDLYASLGYDMDILKKRVREEITRGIATSLTYEQIGQNISSYTDVPIFNAKNIARTEGHRIQQASAHDARKKAKAKGADLVKQWDATMDGVTRKVHKELDGQIREIDEHFTDRTGKWKALYPGKFGKPEQDCQCRCVALTRARSALDEKELETLKERAKYFGLDKTEDFNEFKEKYLKGAAIVEKTEKDGIINYNGKRHLAIPQAKLSGYALNPQKDPNKAKAFEMALGYTMSNAADLEKNIFDHLDEENFIEKGDTGYGMRYENILTLTGPNGKQANVMTAWIDDGNGGKRLTSIYVTKREAKK